MIKAVVNADDFGISESVNNAIIQCFQKRIISNTTLMVNMDAADDAVELAEKYGFYDRVGIHLNLTAGYPLTDGIRRSPLFCDADGRFNAKFHLSTKSRLRLSSEDSRYVYAEVEAQLRRYLEYGLPEKHLDSHHHVHTDMSVWKMLKPLLKKYNFRTVRIGRNMYDKASIFNVLYKKNLNAQINRAGYACSDYFGSFEDFKNYSSTIGKNDKIEIMLHPMYSEDGKLMDTDIPIERISRYFEEKRVIVEAISL